MQSAHRELCTRGFAKCFREPFVCALHDRKPCIVYYYKVALAARGGGGFLEHRIDESAEKYLMLYVCSILGARARMP